MFAVTGITGNVGGEVARNLLAAGQPVRGVVRETRKGETWATRGCDLVEADINDEAALTAAFKGAAGVFVLVPPNFDPSPGLSRSTGCSRRSAIGDRRRASREKSCICRPSVRIPGEGEQDSGRKPNSVPG